MAGQRDRELRREVNRRRDDLSFAYQKGFIVRLSGTRWLKGRPPMHDIPNDIFTEQAEIDVDTLANLGPLRHLAGIWEGSKSLDVNPFTGGERRQRYVEHIELQPIDPQSNGPQLFYGLRYHCHIVKPGDVETYHDQVGYWLWEPATELLTHTLTIPRGQTVLASGRAAADAMRF